MAFSLDDLLAQTQAQTPQPLPKVQGGQNPAAPTGLPTVGSGSPTGLSTFGSGLPKVSSPLDDQTYKMAMTHTGLTHYNPENALHQLVDNQGVPLKHQFWNKLARVGEGIGNVM